MEKNMITIVEKYGKNGLCFHVVYGFKTLVIISNPQYIKKIAFHPNMADKPDIMYGGFGTYLGGPFARPPSDDLWKEKRKEYNVTLKRSLVDSHYFTTFLKCADKLVDLMLASPSAVNVHHKSSGITQSVALETMFGVETRIIYHPDVIKFMTEVGDIASFFVANPYLAKIMLILFRPFDKIFFAKVAQLRQVCVNAVLGPNPNPPTERSLLTQIASRSKKCNKTKRIVDEIQEMFITSSHTVTSAIANSLVFFALLPDMQERAWEEQYEIFGDDKRDPTMEDVTQMVFLDRYIKESLRFLAPSFLGKLATEDVTVGGITIPRGSNVVYLMRYMRMDPKYWKNPEVFDPDRFLEESESLQQPIYAPFGIGIRNCPGMHFATMLMKITLSKVLRRLKLKTVDENFRFEDIRYKCCLMTEVVNAPLLQVKERT